ncbi:hypothetical protein GDO81_016022 [Engystomops pustulosus]|uniref:Uncharacterized protein n=1 Tax=Engystomops pustulosus TaxID=76066 RepID=A0AAV7AUV8_ENGPU|nr:hypothetical protein GDO81_016022 [Engystomops pustulosus]
MEHCSFDIRDKQSQGFILEIGVCPRGGTYMYHTFMAYLLTPHLKATSHKAPFLSSPMPTQTKNSISTVFINYNFGCLSGQLCPWDVFFMVPSIKSPSAHAPHRPIMSQVHNLCAASRTLFLVKWHTVTSG